MMDAETSTNNVSVEIMDAEPSNDISLVIVGSETSKSPHPADVASDFRIKPWVEAECLGTPPSTPPKPCTPKTPRSYAESEGDTPSSPILEADVSRDSLDIPTLRQVLEFSPQNAPMKTTEPPGAGFGSTPSTNTPSKVSDPLYKRPCLYESHHASCLPENREPYKKLKEFDDCQKVVDTSNLEAASSSDSFCIPTSRHNVFEVYSRKKPMTAGKTRTSTRQTQAPASGSESTPLKNMPSKISNLQSKGPSLYKSEQPKGLLKDIKPCQKKRKERNESPEGFEKSATPHLEAVSSSDSFVIPTSKRNFRHLSSWKIPKKSDKTRETKNKTQSPASGSGSTPLINTPIKLSKLQNKELSPYKSSQTKDLPKNIKPLKKKHSDTLEELHTSNLEAASSDDDSFNLPTLRQVLETSPQNTPTKTTQSPASESESSPSKKSPSKVSSPQKQLSSFKSSQPNYVPKDMKPFKMKRKERSHSVRRVGKPDASCLEEASSSDIHTFIRDVWKTPRKVSKTCEMSSRDLSPASKSGSTPLKNTPSKVSDVKDREPSLHKSNRPKYVPKDMKPCKKKPKERDASPEKVDTPNLEAASSSDSLFILTSKRNVVQVSSGKTPTKGSNTRKSESQAQLAASGSGSLPSKNTPREVSDIKDRGPPPYKSCRPKYVPKDLKPYKEKRKEHDSLEEVDTSNLEATSSSDSFFSRKPKYNVTQVSSRKTPTKDSKTCNTKSQAKSPASRSGSASSKNTPSRVSNIKDKGPSPYKSRRPKYLPKNTSLVKKKRQERNDFLKKVEKYEAQLLKLPSASVSPERVVDPYPDNDLDVMGTCPPLFVFFDPVKVFAIYDEHSFDAHFDVNIAELTNLVKLNPHLATEKDYRALILFLTVCSDASCCDIVSYAIEDYLIRSNYVLDWNDLKNILVNFGLAKSHGEFNSAIYYRHGPPKLPKIWNFEFLFKVVGYSFPSYSTTHLKRLLLFLVDCLFEPVLQKRHYEVGTLVQQVTEHIVDQGGTLDELVSLLDRGDLSWVCNRVIIQFLSHIPRLKTLARTMAYRTVHSILGAEYSNRPSMLSHIAHLLTDIGNISKKTSLKDVYQLIAICENLVVTSSSPFDCETKAFLEKLAAFAEDISQGYSHFDRLIFNDSIFRLQALTNIDGF